MCGVRCGSRPCISRYCAPSRTWGQCHFPDEIAPQWMLGAAAQAEWGIRCGLVLRRRGDICEFDFPFSIRFGRSARPLSPWRFREAQIVSTDGSVYCLISLAFSLVAYSAFRLHDGVLRFFNVKDAWNVVRAVACAEVMTCVLLFTLTRLENIPRSTPLISCTDFVRRAHRCPGACPDE